jgi:hypothetical protein
MVAVLSARAVDCLGDRVVPFTLPEESNEVLLVNVGLKLPLLPPLEAYPDPVVLLLANAVSVCRLRGRPAAKGEGLVAVEADAEEDEDDAEKLEWERLWSGGGRGGGS